MYRTRTLLIGALWVALAAPRAAAQEGLDVNEPAPAQSTPTQATPAQSTPTQAAPAQPAPAQASPTQPAPAQPVQTTAAPSPYDARPEAPPPQDRVIIIREERAPLAEEPPKPEKDGRWFIGGFYRHTFTPRFLMKPFLQEFTSTSNHGAGGELTYSRKKLDISIVGFWQAYNTYGPFLVDGDPPTDTEMINSSLSQAGAGVNFLWNAEISSKFAFMYGFDLGAGYVFGRLRRTEAYQSSDPSAPGYKGGWAPCAGVGDPDPMYCEGPSVPDGEEGGHYNVTSRKWTNGGSVPNAWFRVAPHLAFRYSPIPGIRIRVDGGFDILSGFFAGGMLAIGL